MLAAPLSYFPISTHPFEFKPGLRRLKPNGAVDRREHLFQLDQQWSEYHRSKVRARREHLGKYVCEQDLDLHTVSRVTAFLIRQLCREHPEQFSLASQPGHARLCCSLSGETLIFDEQLALTDVLHPSASPPYRDALDALCCQIQEDLSIITVDRQHTPVDSIRYLHLCLPNYWAAKDKIGSSFISAHAPVPDMDKINNQSAKLIATLLRKGSYERFTWGLTTDSYLNHHPQAPAGLDADQWYGRSFDPHQPVLYLRSERQVITALPDINSFVFTIRTYLRDVGTLTAAQRRQLARSVRTMPVAIRVYKGLAETHAMITTWLETME